jgi:hypothetical protein
VIWQSGKSLCATSRSSPAIFATSWAATAVGKSPLHVPNIMSLGTPQSAVISWSSVEGECDPTFELAVDAVVRGRINDLRALLAEHPDLSLRRSAYGHRATLLHYTAANGVEIRRQVVPANAAEVVVALLDAGLDRSARLQVARLV